MDQTKKIQNASLSGEENGTSPLYEKVQNAGLAGTHGKEGYVPAPDEWPSNQKFVRVYHQIKETPMFDEKQHKALANINEVMQKPALLTKADFLCAARIHLTMVAMSMEGLPKESYITMTRNLLIAVESIRNMTPSKKAWDRITVIMNSWKAYYSDWNFDANPNIELPGGLVESFSWMYDYFEKHMLNLNQTRFAAAIVEIDNNLETLGMFKESELSKRAQIVLTAALGFSNGTFFN